MTAIPLQFVRHVLNGLFATAIHFGALSFNLFVLQLESAGIANLIAALAGTCASFVGNRYFVFRASSGPSVRQAAAFGILYGFIALLHGAILYVWTDLNGLDYRLGFILATGVQVMISYVGNKTWVFKIGAGSDPKELVE